MTLYFRLFFTLMKAYFSKPLGATEASEASFRVWPQDMDLGDLNAAKYFSFNEVSQQANNLRTGFLKLAIRNRWWVIVASQMINYHKRIPLFSKFRVSAQVIGWDSKYFYWENKFFRNKDLCTLAYSKVQIRSSQGAVPINEVLSSLGLPVEERRVDSQILQKLERLNVG